MVYSSSHETSEFLKQAGNYPFVVSDMDGNVLDGYIVNGKNSVGEVADPKIQSISYDIPTANLELMVQGGAIRHAIFAKKRMDVRLPQDMVAMINDQIARGQIFRTAFLTSRGEEDTFKILRASGVTHPEKMTLATDSGAVVWIAGKRTVLREPTKEETSFLSNAELVANNLRLKIEGLIRQHVPGFTGDLPALVLEKKKIATNIHWREILDKTGQKEGSPLDDAISKTVKDSLNNYALMCTMNDHPEGTFMALDGPMTVELKLADINKALGLSYIIEHAVAATGQHRPTSVIFTGDDVANKKGSPGTDWFAMDGITALGHKHGIPTFNIHTHHPEDEALDGTTPDPNKSPDNLSYKWPKPPIHLTVASPQRLVEVIMRIDDTRLLWDSEAPLDVGMHHA